MKFVKSIVSVLAVASACAVMSENVYAQACGSCTTGSTGIGTASPARKLHVKDNNPQIRIEDNTNAWDIWGGSNLLFTHVSNSITWLKFDDVAHNVQFGPNSDIYIDLTLGNVGNVGIGTTSPVSKLTVNGSITPGASCSFDLGSSARTWQNLYYCGSLILSSDATLKDNIHDINYGLDAIMRLRPVTYTLKQNAELGTKLGLIAQEVQPVIGEIVHKQADGGTLGVSYLELVPVLIKAVQEQQSTITTQSAKIDQQAAENQALRQKLSDQEARLARIESAMNLGYSGGSSGSGANLVKLDPKGSAVAAPDNR